MIRIELPLLGLCIVLWAVALLALLGILPLAGLLALDLYRFFSLAAILGWLSGNVYVQRRRRLPDQRFRRRLLLVYLLGPPALLYLLRALAPYAEQNAAPLVPLYSCGVYALFFLIPITLRPPSLRSRRD